MPSVFWAALMERSVQEDAVNALLGVAMRAGQLGYHRIVTPYARTDWARNQIVRMFCEATDNPLDVLVMLDADHAHPYDVVERLAAHELDVVGALAFRRSAPYDPCFFARDETDVLRGVADWEPGIKLPVACSIVGTGAICIRRRVFTKLDAAGYPWPYFRYSYPGEEMPTEDIYFGRVCEEAGIRHYCDLTLETPHLAVRQIGERTWRAYQRRVEGETNGNQGGA